MPPKDSAKQPFQLTPEQLAKQAARRELKAQKVAQETQGRNDDPLGRILQRDWLKSKSLTEANDGNTVTIMTWNMLAQSLVRRELFPGSDALKFTTRGPMLPREILTYNADILCLQEVDRLDNLLPALSSRYSHIYASGHKKEHGCMIAFNKDIFEVVAHQTIYYDEEDVRQGNDTSLDDDASSRWRRGTSRITKNIGLIVGLRRKDHADNGFTIATTHLFWHPAYVYERCKQVGILLRAVAQFRDQHGTTHLPCFIAGDLNLTPSDPTYSLLVGESMTEPQTGDLNRSRVVHISVDPTINFEVPKPIRKQRESDEEAGEGNEDDDSDREITNSRPCMDSDGLLNVEELCSFIGSSPIIPLRSAYGDVLGLGAEGVETHGQRTQKTDERKGTHEPAYTSYTHFWKNTLDYIFFSTPDNCQATVEAILKPHRTEDMGDGLPKQDICGSDHISLAAKITFITDPKERR